MFESDFYTIIKEQFPDLQLGFGEVNENLNDPYAIMYVLSRSGKRKVLSEEDQYESGSSFVQFNIYTSESAYGLTLLDELDKFINGLRHIESEDSQYDVWCTDQSGTTSLTLANGLAVNVLAKIINYEVK